MNCLLITGLVAPSLAHAQVASSPVYISPALIELYETCVMIERMSPDEEFLYACLSLFVSWNKTISSQFDTPQ